MTKLLRLGLTLIIAAFDQQAEIGKGENGKGRIQNRRRNGDLC
jgi:hypothetical protein